MEEILLLIRASHSSPKVSCSALSAPLRLSSRCCSLVFGLEQRSVKCVGIKHPPEFLRAGGASLPSSANVLFCSLSWYPDELSGFRQVLLSWGFAQEWLLLCGSEFLSPSGIRPQAQPAWAECSAVCPGFAVHTCFSRLFEAWPPKPFRPHGCHPPRSLLPSAPHSRRLKSFPSHIITSDIITLCRTKRK